LIQTTAFARLDRFVKACGTSQSGDEGLPEAIYDSERGETMLSNKKLLTASRPAWMAVLSLLAVAALTLPASAQKVNITYLTSDINAVGSFMDTNLVNPWGMSVSPSGPWWFSDNGTGLSTLYIASGQPQSLVVLQRQHHRLQDPYAGNTLPVLH
jgi:hypothetical protein